MTRRFLLVAGLLPVLLACMAGAPAGSPPAPAPNSVADGARLYVANQTASTISVIDIKSQKLIETLLSAVRK